MNLNVQKQLWLSHVYQTHQTTLLSWFKHKLQHHHQSEDLSQEVFYRALKSNYCFTSIKEPQAWLMGIAKHVMIDHWRRQHIERLYLEALAHLPEEFYPSAEHEVCIRETLYQVHVMLEKLPQRTAQVFLLSQLDGLTYYAIAEKLDISEATVKRDMKQAFLACINLYNSEH
ncbi:sigma-70 family RNA polymerase sigma factor [Acinetobacter bohemicus]|jgi:RNA polymerase sigma factor (sigma-70 family)|uniref:RNA polymerase sigma-70 factor, ECF subfamily n=1 Tax=Acinetobacter bohemicus TaxID=1435036 RepID=A0A1I6QJX2_9GAMM|nr:sigma-70 family RNA polymerase sigma factor [Acinetobacter bohemicus]KAB0653925.1 sigma-70 family RNA polymerase sigma factor [Acinetobacter bohemicus]SFS52787.1 RNA polymerase sigma-70 factor, ECF subfamily [Acinetobacter bohemicus]